MVILDNIRSAHNVGSIFRTSDGAGVSRILLGGYTPAPIDRFGREQPEITKTSLGATKTVPWESVAAEALGAKIKELQTAGFTIVAVEQANDSVLLQDFSLQGKTCYIFGNEIEGVRSEILNLSDTILEIPMQGHKESLNVGVSVGIVLFNARP